MNDTFSLQDATAGTVEVNVLSNDNDPEGAPLAILQGQHTCSRDCAPCKGLCIAPLA